MDRYTGRDEALDDNARQPMGRVARSGLGGFVRSDTGMGNDGAQTAAKVEVVVSRREQKKQQNPPTPPAPAEAPAPTSLSGYQPPSWAGRPPAGLHMCLAVMKDGQVIQEIPLVQPATVFGRTAGADVVLEHQSVSRQHAAICYHSTAGKWVVVDLGSVHGTFVDGKPVSKASPVELKLGSQVRFGASTRQYLLRRQQSAALAQRSAGAAQEPAQRPAGRRNVQWPDGDNPASTSGSDQGRSNGASGLEQIIGYSDSRNFTVRVGPEPASSDAQGRFADLVKVREEPADDTQPRSGQKRPAHLGSPPAHAKRPAAVQPLGGAPLQSRSGSGGKGFYDWLPPPGSRGS